jgi:hypothetical protein
VKYNLNRLGEKKFPLPHITATPQLWGLPGHCGVKTNPGLFEKQLKNDQPLKMLLKTRKCFIGSKLSIPARVSKFLSGAKARQLKVSLDHFATAGHSEAILPLRA